MKKEYNILGEYEQLSNEIDCMKQSMVLLAEYLGQDIDLDSRINTQLFASRKDIYFSLISLLIGQIDSLVEKNLNIIKKCYE